MWDIKDALFKLGLLFFGMGLAHFCLTLLLGDYIKDSVIVSGLLQISGVSFIGSATYHFLTKK